MNAEVTHRPPAEVTLATCIGCGAMTLPGNCLAGCSGERKLELVAAGELDELVALTEQAEAQTDALRALAASFSRQAGPPTSDGQEAEGARAALAAARPVRSRLRELATMPVEPVVSWWCPACGGLDAPQPCLGVCVRKPVRWANAERLRELHARAAELLADSDELAAALTLVAHTHPQPGEEARHWHIVRERSARAAGDGKRPRVAL